MRDISVMNGGTENGGVQIIRIKKYELQMDVNNRRIKGYDEKKSV